MKKSKKVIELLFSVAGVLTRQLATATQIFDYQLIMNIEVEVFAFASWLVRTPSHGTEWFYQPRKWKQYFFPRCYHKGCGTVRRSKKHRTTALQVFCLNGSQTRAKKNFIYSSYLSICFCTVTSGLFKNSINSLKTIFSVAGVLTRQLATATQIFDYQLIMNIEVEVFAFASWLVRTPSHGTEWFYQPRK